MTKCYLSSAAYKNAIELAKTSVTKKNLGPNLDEDTK